MSSYLIISLVEMRTCVFSFSFAERYTYPRCFVRTPYAGNTASISCFVREFFTRSASTQIQRFDILDEISTNWLDKIERVKPYDPKY